MEENKRNKNTITIQEILSLGYIYLLILGVIHNAVYYNFIGVNYLEYTSILDVLISPISVITSNFKSALAFLGILIISLIYLRVIIPIIVRWRRKQRNYQSGKNLEKINKMDALAKSNNTLLFIMALFVFGYFIGFGYGAGKKNKSLIENDEVKNNTQIEFTDNSVLEAKLLGKNSLNIFYISKGDKTVTISPIEGNIKKISRLPK